MMNRFFTLLLAASCLTAVGQEECTDISSTFNFSALYLEADYYAADSIHYFYVRFYPNGMGEYWQLNSYSIFGILSFEYSLCEQNGEIFYTDSWLYEAQVNPSGVFEGTTNLGYPFTYTPVRGGSPFETETNSCGWQPDGNGDNLIGVNDLLDLLGVYGDTDYDQDGIWDSADDCVGEYDECGVCNGSGPSIPIIESIEILYDSVYAEQIDEWFVFEVGADTTYQYVCGLGCTDPLSTNYDPSADTDDGSCIWTCGNPMEYQGYSYETVLLGARCWFAENLRCEFYENGDPILSNLSDSEWGNTNDGAQAVYGEGMNTCQSFSPSGNDCDENWSLVEYGRLYNWFAVEDARGLCPIGWHVPSDDDWITMEMSLGMSSLEANATGYRGTNQGTQMKTTFGWENEQSNGSNSSGFGVLPGGYKSSDTNFYNAGRKTWFWSSTFAEENPANQSAWIRVLSSDVDSDFMKVFRGTNYIKMGHSVRCIKDNE